MVTLHRQDLIKIPLYYLTKEADVIFGGGTRNRTLIYRVRAEDNQPLYYTPIGTPYRNLTALERSKRSVQIHYTLQGITEHYYESTSNSLQLS